MPPGDPAALPLLDEPYPLDPGCVAQAREAGHTVVRGLATPEEVDAYRDVIAAAAEARNRETRPLEERDTYGRAFLQSPNLWRIDEGVRRFVFAPRFARVAAELLGVGGVRLYHDQALFKEPGGGHTPWHQDQVYWPLDTDRTITLWMPLVDVPPEVGSMTFAAGSHRLGDLRGPAISDESEAAFDRLVREHRLPLETHGAMRRGDATFHLGWTLHRAAPNPTGDMRAVMTIIYFADGARVTQPANDYQEFDRRMWLRVEPGRVADHERNPRLWPQS